MAPTSALNADQPQRVSERTQACGEGFCPTSGTGHVDRCEADEFGDLLGLVCARYEVDHTVCAPPPTGSLLTSLLTGPTTNAATREAQASDLGFLVELRRIELLTSSMPWKRSAN